MAAPFHALRSDPDMIRSSAPCASADGPAHPPAARAISAALRREIVTLARMPCRAAEAGLDARHRARSEASLAAQDALGLAAVLARHPDLL